MARQEYKVQTNNFTGGFITEASPLSFPENSCLDILNMDINPDGSVERRQGLMRENSTDISSRWPAYAYEAVVSSYVWRNAGGISGNNFLVVQNGEGLIFLKEGDDLTPADTPVYIMNSLKPAGTTLFVEDEPVSMTDINGILIVVGRALRPFYVEYEPDGFGNLFNINTIDIRIRDLDGLDDGLAVATRPRELTSNHYYNLLNQGWDFDKMNFLFTLEGVWPSNADIWHTGRNADNLFTPVELLKIDFGTSPAPKGRFILDPFDTFGSYNTLFPEGTPIEISNITRTIAVGNYLLDITTASPHGLVANDSFIIIGNEVVCEGVNTSLDGEYVVSSVPNTTTIRLSKTTPWCLNEYEEINWGNIHNNYRDFNDEGYSTTERPSATASYAGRVWYAGTQHKELADKVFFSQIVSTENNVGKCHTVADPTSEIDSDIVETDGGVLSINGLGLVLHMAIQQASLVIFTSTGVWEIKGEGDSYFSATGYQIRKVTSVPVISSKSITEIEGRLTFMGQDGIYILENNEVSSFLQAVNITADNIKTYYINEVAACGCNVRSVYDYKKRRVMWLYGYPPEEPTGEVKSPGGGLEGKRLVLSRALVFDISTRSFTKYQFPFTPGEIIQEEGEANIMDAIVLRDISAYYPCVRFIYRYTDRSSGAPINRIGFAYQARPKEEGMYDLDGREVVSYLYTGHATLGDIGVKKVPRQLILYMQRTEKGFTIDGEEYTPIHPSSAKVRVAWDFTADEETRKWQQEFQGYRYRQLYLSNGSAPTHPGQEVIVTKTGLRGNGRAFSLRFMSEPGKDMKILGWSITGSVEGRE